MVFNGIEDYNLVFFLYEKVSFKLFNIYWWDDCYS